MRPALTLVFAAAALAAQVSSPTRPRSVTSRGSTRIGTRFERLSSTSQFGPEYLTYVLWAITPEGRPSDLGELILGGSQSRLLATTKLTGAEGCAQGRGNRRAVETTVRAEEEARAAAGAPAVAAEAARGEAETERNQLRRRLQQQLGMVLETRETARGLVANISDVLFHLDKATLKPAAREKLAKVSGILLAYQGLTLRLEGHTDSTGSQPYNVRLSQDRAGAVRAYLVQQGVSPASMTAVGLGEANPVAGNETAAGRQQNRRVELVVSGDAIGIPAPAGR